MTLCDNCSKLLTGTYIYNPKENDGKKFCSSSCMNSYYSKETSQNASNFWQEYKGWILGIGVVLGILTLLGIISGLIGSLKKKDYTLDQFKDYKSFEKYEKRKTWIKVIAFFLAVIFAFISGNLLCKVGLTESRKIFSYSWGTEDKSLKPENQSKLPKDYTEWYKKVRQNAWAKKFGKKEDYFTKKAIAEREYEENKKKAGGGILGDFAAWWLSKNLSEEEGKKVDYYHYAHHIYCFTAFFLIASWVIFIWLDYLLFRHLILPLVWREPKPNRY